jgi:hypothetical protein
MNTEASRDAYRRQSLLAREKNLFLGAWKKKTGKLILSYMVHRTFPSEKH